MFLFYNNNGKIRGACGAGSPNDELTYIPEGTTLLYCDDNEYPYIGNNLSDYTIQNNIPVYTPIPDIIKLPPLKEAKIEEINIACNKEILDGFKSSCTGIEHQYKFTEEWQTNLNRQMNSLIIDDLVDSIEWNTVDAGVINHTRRQFITLYQDSKTFIDSKISNYYNIKQQVMNCQNTNDVRLINW